MLMLICKEPKSIKDSNTDSDTLGMTRAEPNRLLSRDVFGPVRKNHHHHNDKSFPHFLSARRARNRVAPYYNQNLYKNSPSSIKAIGGEIYKAGR